jgi:hypothetical protein
MSLDVSQERTGWALLQGLEVLEYGSISIAPGSENFPSKLLSYQMQVKSILDTLHEEHGQIHCIVMEDMNMKTKFNAGKVLMQFQASAKIACALYDNEIDVNLVNNISVKSFFKVISRKTAIPESILSIKKGIRNAKITPVKIQMVIAVNKCFPELKLTYEQNDEADAIGMAFYIIKEIMKEVQK